MGKKTRMGIAAAGPSVDRRAVVSLPKPAASAPTLPFTGERFVPSERGAIAYEHYHRYAACAEAVRGKVVLDVACGEGFGAAILARTAAKVIGVDIDPAAVRHASNAYGQLNGVTFLVGDCRALPLPTASVDLVVSFETIEHIREHEQMLDELVRVLRPRGSLIISSPDKANYDERSRSGNRFHLRELTHECFVGLLQARFPRVRVYRQRLAIGSFVLADEWPGSTTLLSFMAGDRGSQPGSQPLQKPVYSLAVCSQAPDSLAPFQSSVHVDPEDDLLLEHERRLRWASSLDDEHEELRGRIRTSEIASASLSAALDAANRERELLRAELGKRDAELARQAAEGTELKAAAARKQAESESLQAELALRMTERDRLMAELAVRCAEIDVLCSELADRSAEAERHQAALAQANAQNDQLDAKLAQRTIEQNEMLVSTSWRITRPLRWAGRTFPASKRHARRLLKLAWWAVTFQLFSRLRARRARRLEAELVASSVLFDREWYIGRYPHVRATGLDPVLHYLDHGAAEGRRPSALFDGEWYLTKNPDVRGAGLNPLVHYLRHGRGEARAANGDGRVSPLERKAGELPPALERLLYALHDPEVIPAMQAMYRLIARHEGSEISTSKLAGLADVQALIAEIAALARARPAPERPDASIIIPVHDKLIYTLCCLNALLIGTSRSSFEIIVADDLSADATPDVVGAIGGVVRRRRNAENLGFTRNCNQAAASARGDVVVLLNNDTIPLPGWLDELVATLRADVSIGLAGCKLVNADGTLQEAGGIVWSDGSAWNFGRGDDAAAPQYNYVKDVDYMSGAAIAVPKPVWERLGGFDELFEPAYCEDTDLAFRVRAVGLRTVYQPFSAVVHHEGISHGRDQSRGVKSYQVRNNRRFFERWRATLEAENIPSGGNVALARDRSRGGPRILFIDHYIPQPDRDAGSRTVCDYLRLFKTAGFHVVLWPQNLYFDRAYATALQRQGIEVQYDLISCMSFADWLRAHGSDLDYVFLSRALVAIDYVDAVRHATAAKILFYGHDIHFKRLGKEFEVTGQHAVREEMIRCERIERQVWSKCDAIYYLSRTECDFVHALHPDKSVQVIPPFLYETARLRRVRERLLGAGIPRSQRLIFVGGFRHRPNVDAMLWFVREVWPRIVSSVPSSRFVIAGSFPPAEIQALAGRDVTVTGFITDEELCELYQSAQIAVVPLRFGAGVKGKVIEALSYGTPVVATSIGAQGLVDAHNFLDVCDTPAEFAATVVEILRDPASRTVNALAGLDFVEARHRKRARARSSPPTCLRSSAACRPAPGGAGGRRHDAAAT